MYVLCYRPTNWNNNIWSPDLSALCVTRAFPSDLVIGNILILITHRGEMRSIYLCSLLHESSQLWIIWGSRMVETISLANETKVYNDTLRFLNGQIGE